MLPTTLKRERIPVKIANTTIPLIALLACFCLAVLGLSTASAEHHETEQANINYNLDIRPILANNCYACHGPDAKARQANLRLDTKAGAFSEPSGYPIIVPNKPEESELHLRIVSAVSYTHLTLPTKRIV